MKENTQNNVVTIVPKNAGLFFIRNYRQRQFRQSKTYKKYLKYIDKKPSEASKLTVESQPLHEQHRIMQMFSNLICPNINKKCQKAYGLDLIDLMVEENITNIINALKQEIIATDSMIKENTKHEKENHEIRLIHLEGIFYTPHIYTFSLYHQDYASNKNTCTIHFPIDIQNKSHIDLCKKIDTECTTIDSLRSNSIFNDISNFFICQAKKEGINLESIKKTYIIIDRHEKYSNEIFIPQDKKINLLCNKFLSEVKSSHKKSLNNKKIILDDINHLLKKRFFLHEFNTKSIYFLKQIKKIKKLSEVLSVLSELSTDNTYKQLNAKINKLSKLCKQNEMAVNKIFDFHIINEFPTHRTSYDTQLLQEMWPYLIGLDIYDKVHEKKTIPQDMIDKILPGNNNNIIPIHHFEKKNLNNYLKTTRRCIEYGFIMPIKS